MKNTFVLKNLKHALSRTESEHKNIGKEKKQKAKVNFLSLYHKHHNHHLNLHLRTWPKIYRRKVMKQFCVLNSGCIEVQNNLKNICQTVREKNEVLNNLASKYNFPIKLKNKRAPYPLPPPRKNYLSEEQEQWLLEMLKRPDMTYTNPGRKDNVYIGKIDGERCYEQNRYLLWKLDNALEI